ncbi:uncharacterized protein TRAVEDRAFT_61232 [Trametes versicolor FP-101664 SS1]|uniref:uncharacterized protein n=1 Tax=Trametes versicolor (strain FP-101664) TaxID=717944 RepID=UPI0004621433|nr:uncharacterized protein TRAVEDRAFT_61232 [Trametes versicolor FP-101664 SS1]EIW53036.1 hypothetical protein TRAVEDRAFT_61232 [Trametes versicolor FP-101664 SS1]
MPSFEQGARRRALRWFGSGWRWNPALKTVLSSHGPPGGTSGGWVVRSDLPRFLRSRAAMPSSDDTPSLCSMQPTGRARGRLSACHPRGAPPSQMR